jgi:hypothetical protein
MNRISLLKTANLACALLQGLGFWLLTVYVRDSLPASPWTHQLLPLASVYLLGLSLAAALMNRTLLPIVARRRWFYSAAFFFTAVYGYLVLFGYGLFERVGDEFGYQRPLADIALFAWGWAVLAAGATLPLWILFSLALGFTLSRLYAKRDYLPEEL